MKECNRCKKEPVASADGLSMCVDCLDRKVRAIVPAYRDAEGEGAAYYLDRGMATLGIVWGCGDE